MSFGGYPFPFTCIMFGAFHLDFFMAFFIKVDCFDDRCLGIPLVFLASALTGQQRNNDNYRLPFSVPVLWAASGINRQPHLKAKKERRNYWTVRWVERWRHFDDEASHSTEQAENGITLLCSIVCFKEFLCLLKNRPGCISWETPAKLHLLLCLQLIISVYCLLNYISQLNCQ